jgi:23S rRNA (adenine2503-C2)-methyltransferase
MNEQDRTMPRELLGLSLPELRAAVRALDEPDYRAAQLYHALYAERRFDVRAMSNLPTALRERLAAEASVTLPRAVRRYASADGSVRYLFALTSGPVGGARADAHGAPRPVSVETVFMPEEDRQTLCISTQAGCAVGCGFCLTATLGLLRNLTAGEIVGQVLAVLAEQHAALKPQTNVVLMGQGEPLLNYDAVMAALRILLDPEGVGLSPRHVTLSTSGIVPGIERLAAEPVRPKLAVSLNASNDEQRDRIMPINRKYPLAALINACRRYPLRSWERLTFEYVLLGGLNDSADDARRVVRLLNSLRAKVNLIPWNPGELPFGRPEAVRVEEFRRILTEKNLPAFIRHSRGQDIMAACGQLASLEAAMPGAPGAPAP